MTSWRRIRLPGRMLLIVIVASACGGTEPTVAPSGTSDVPADGPSAIEQVFAQVGPDGEITRDVALQAFAVAFGPLPGVTTPSGPRGELDSGTTVIGQVQRYWDELTPDQQAAARTAVGDPALLPSAGGSGIPARLAGFGFTPRAAMTAAASCVVSDAAAPYQGHVDESATFIAGHLGRPLKDGSQPCVTISPTQYPDPDHPLAPIVKASAGLTPGEGCRITIYPAGYDMDDADMAWLMAHEVMHCFQQDLVTPAGNNIVHGWVVEGAAAWVGRQYIGGTPAFITIKHWKPWLEQPAKPLFSRSYDAMGWYFHLEESAGAAGVWGKLDAQLTAGLNGQDVAAYDTAMALAPAVLLEEWGPSYHRASSTLGKRWDFVGLDVPVTQPAVQQIAVGNDTYRLVDVGSFAAAAARLDAFADVVTVSTGDLPGLVALPGGLGDLPLEEIDGVGLCTRPDGCACADGSAGSTRELIQIAKGTIRLGAAGDLSDGTIVIKGETLAEFCGGCLLGAWRLDHDSYRALLEGVFAAWPDASVHGLDGDLTLTFEPGLLTARYDSFGSSVSYSTERPVGADAYVTVSLGVDGHLSGTYSVLEATDQADGTQRVTVLIGELDEAALDSYATVSIARGPATGISSPVPAVVQAGEVALSCSEDTLTFELPGFAAGQTITYRRMTS